MAWTEGTAYGEWITICKMLPCEASLHRFVGLIFFTIIWVLFAILFLKNQLQNQKRGKDNGFYVDEVEEMKNTTKEALFTLKCDLDDLFKTIKMQDKEIEKLYGKINEKDVKIQCRKLGESDLD